MRTFTSLIFLTAFVSTAFAQGGPTVSNVIATQRADGSRLVDIHYDLANQTPCTVWPVLSADGGTSWSVPAMSFAGDLGPNITPGTNRTIVWDAGADIPGVVGTYRARVYADDGNTLTNMVPVPGGTFPYQRNFSNQVFVGSFYIDKYEVTNQRYAEFLNSADPNGTYWNSSIEITRSGSPPNVFYAPYPGKQNYPVRYVSAVDAQAYAAWLSAREGRNYRLPTQQEWEKAAAWDPTISKHWVYAFQSDSIACVSSNNGSGCNSSCIGTTTEVGHYNGTNGTNNSRSFYGCYDMTGNVWEWTGGGTSDQVIRGGGYSAIFDCSSDWLTTTGRNRQATERYPYWGFRLVLDLN